MGIRDRIADAAAPKWKQALDNLKDAAGALPGVAKNTGEVAASAGKTGGGIVAGVLGFVSNVASRFASAATGGMKFAVEKARDHKNLTTVVVAVAAAVGINRFFKRREEAKLANEAERYRESVEAHRAMQAQMAQERAAVAAQFGQHNPADGQWVERSGRGTDRVAGM